MKLDQETLSKHRFWIVYGVMVPLLLLCMLYLATAVATTNQRKKSDLLLHKTRLDKAAKDDLKGVEYMKLLTKRTTDLEKQRLELWEQAYEMQKEMQTWPKEVQDSIGKLEFGDEIHPDDASRYARNTVYPPQIRELGEKAFRTTIDVGNDKVPLESVRFDKGWENVLVYVKEDPWKRAPSSMEVWLAQEDLWLQRELLNAVKEANLSVGRFQLVKNDPQGKPYPTELGPGERFRAHFLNPYWHLDLILAERGAQHVLKGTIQNRPDTRRQLQIGRLYFDVQLNKDGKPVALPIEGEALAPGQEWPIKEFPLPGLIIPEGLLAVTQLYDVRDAPVRQVVQILIANAPQGNGVAHRLANRPLLPIARGKETATPPPPPAKGQPAPTGLTQNGLIRDRYTDVSKEVRRLPFGLVVLVDQAHIPELLTAIANCRLRAQVTQVGWQHYRGSIPVDPAFRPKGKGPPITEIPQTNVVELVLYGVASMYERYQPPGKDAPSKNDVPKDAKGDMPKDATKQ